jgi:putative ABC transport system permease protein
MLKDVRFALRLIAKDPWYTTIVVLVMALGIGVNSIGFTIVNAAFLRGPSFERIERIFLLSWQPRNAERWDISFPELQDLRSQTRAFEAIGAFEERQANISDDRDVPQQVQAARVTANAFQILRQKPLRGRDFAPGEDNSNAERVAILGYSLWQSRYGADPSVLGKTLRINGEPAKIIGIMPDGMKFPLNSDLWFPLVPTDIQLQRDAHMFRAFGRLRDGVSRRDSQAEMNGIAQRLAIAYPETNRNLTGSRVETFTERFVGGQARAVFPIIMAAAGLVLLIACANVANLLLARSANRAREIAVRIAIGASRARVFRQLLVESVVLSCIGGIIGLSLAYLGTRAIESGVTDPGRPYWIVFNMDTTVLIYVVAICVGTGILFGLAPALHVSRSNLQDIMKQSGRGLAGGRRMRWLSDSMVIVELALALTLLVAAGLMARSFLNLYKIDLGFRPENLMSMRLQLPEEKYATRESRNAFFGLLEQRVASVPGIQSVAFSTFVPPLGSGFRPLQIEGRTTPYSGERGNLVGTVTISRSFFDVLQVPLLRGRAFTSADGAPGAENVVINGRLADQFFRGEDPIGKRIRFSNQEAWRTIVGVCSSIRHSTRDSEVYPAAYLPLQQEAFPSVALIIRSPLPPASVLDAVRREVQAIDPNQPVFTFATLDQLLSDYRWGLRTFGGLFAVFAVIALLLSAAGLHAVMAYAVTMRTQEIGVRIALGAQPQQILRLVLKRGMIHLAAGVILGLGGALLLSRLLRSVLFRVSAFDPLTFAAIAALMILVSLAACLAPARRAVGIDAMEAIRME